MDLLKLKEMMQKDSFIDEMKLDSESLSCLSLDNKYQMLYLDVAKEVIQIKSQLNVVRREVSDYWLGKAPDEVYKERPKHQKVLKTDVDTYIKADEDYYTLDNELKEKELILKILEDFLKQLSQRGFNIKNAIDYRKFVSGGN